VRASRSACVFRGANLPARAPRRCSLLLGALALAGCAANCLRDSDCDDAHVCRHDRCELPGSSASDSGLGNAGEAGAAALGPSTSSGGAAGSASTPNGGAAGSASGAGGSASGAGGSASDAGGSASVTDTASGGSATGGRENLDASGD